MVVNVDAHLNIIISYLKKAKEHTFQSLLANDHLSDENDEDRDKVLEITISDPTKVGDGMGSYMTYKLTVKVNSFSNIFKLSLLFIFI